MLNEVEIPKLPPSAIEEGIQRFKETEILEYIYCVRLAHLLSNDSPGNSRGDSIHQTLRNTLLMGSLGFLKCSVVTIP